MSDRIDPVKIGEDEAREIRNRIAEDDESPTTIRAIAEATGMSVEQVHAHLDQIRREKAFAGPAKRTVPLAGWISGAVIALVAGLYLFYFVPWGSSSAPVASVKFAPGVVQNYPVRQPLVRNPEGVTLAFGEGAAYPDIEAEIMGPGHEYLASARLMDAIGKPKLSYRAKFVQLESSLVTHIRLSASKTSEGFEPGMLYRDINGNSFSPKHGMAHYAIRGDCNEIEGDLKAFAGIPTSAQLGEIDAIVKKALAGRENQAGDPNEELPPPGFMVWVNSSKSFCLNGPAPTTRRNRIAERTALTKSVKCLLEWEHRDGGDGTATVTMAGYGYEAWFSYPFTTSDQLPTKAGLTRYQETAIKEYVDKVVAGDTK